MKLTVEQVKQNEDGTTTIGFDYDEEFLDLAKKEMNKEDPSEEEVSEFIFRLLYSHIAANELKRSEESQEKE